ncbi:MAG: 16S rRNA (guanine(527)-N(7))-methyltransferase RsmG [Fimbriimonadaceae bacterium]|nr:16S rRNA (guanine(527)-N(7))-methyltransferase RsmG [Fimbriimonadaceae bacterium]QYK59379.1 MAG: 16S rRNA (guanine(527)-N(7))-methyltransferase RsmG [Fimbriimonadaceae bacterium]
MTGLDLDWGPLVAWCQENGLEWPLGALDRLDRFARALYERNQVMNLTRVPPEEAVVRHFLDSLLVVPVLRPFESLLDVGTGPGFPAWPIACLLPETAVVALESSSKPLSFLREHPLPNLEVVQTRVEDWGRRESFDVVTGRAFAPLAVQLEVSAPFCRVGGAVVPFRTAKEADEARRFPARELGLTMEETFEVELPGDGAVRMFPVFRKSKKTPAGYPRRWAEIKARPLGT